MGLAVCQCGQCVDDMDIVACHICGDASCEDCWVECEYCGHLVCMNCSGAYTTKLCYSCEAVVMRQKERQKESGYVSKGFLIIAGEVGKKFMIKDSTELINATNEDSFAKIRILDIKGLGRLKYSYRSLIPVYATVEEGIEKEIGVDYCFICYRIDDELKNPPF